MNNKLHYLLFTCLFIGTYTSFANEFLNLHINISEGGDVSKRKSQRLLDHLSNNGCKINSISSEIHTSIPLEASFAFLPLERDILEGYSKVADINIFNDEKLSSSILVRSSTGISNISSLKGVRIALFSSESKIGYQLPQALFNTANIVLNNKKITTVQTNLAAAALLLHKDVFAAAIATPLANKWAKSNSLTIVATSSTINPGNLWAHKTVPLDTANTCVQAFSELNKTNDKKLLALFPAWVNGFRYINR